MKKILTFDILSLRLSWGFFRETFWKMTMKKRNLLSDLEYNAIPNSINKISGNTEDRKDSFPAKVLGLKYLFLCFLSAFFFWGTPTNTWGAEITIDGVEYTLSDENNTASVTDCDTSVTQVTIPAIVTYNDKTYSVTSIGDYAFEDCGRFNTVLFLRDQPSAGNGVFFSTPNLHCIYFTEGKKGWEDGSVWEDKTTRPLIMK